MKKFLLSLTFLSAALFGKSQVVLNELYVAPGSGQHEFFELYNSSSATESLDNYTLVSLYRTNASSGFIVINLPNINLPVGGFSVGASTTPTISYQGGTYTLNSLTDFSWAAGSMPSSGYIKNLQRSGSTYNEVPIGNYNDIFQTIQGGSTQYVTLLYKNGVLINGLYIGSNSIQSVLSGMPVLNVPTDGSVTAAFSIDFNAIQNNQLEFVGQGIGSNNGAYRESDGLCGAWNKSANATPNTPGKTNGSSTSTENVIFVGGQTNCETRVITYFIVNSQTSAAAYPLVLQLYLDNGSVRGELDAGDKIVQENVIASAPASGTSNTNYTYTIPASSDGSVIIVAKSTAGCFQTIEPITNSCSILPVTYASFTATRTNNNQVVLNWETAMEVNNKGFYVQRLVNGEWKNIGFVFTAADKGNSTSSLQYSFKDANSSKGISQYRILQVDIDGKGRYSEIRAIRGVEMAARLTVFPNPSSNGAFNLLFEDATSVRDVIVSDVSGRAVKQFKNVSSNSLNVEGLNGGFYTVQVLNRTTGVVATEKVIIKKR